MEEKVLVDLNGSMEISSSKNNCDIKIVNGKIRIPFLDYVDKTQLSGRWAPVFASTSLERQEEYIERMIERDKKL